MNRFRCLQPKCVERNGKPYEWDTRLDIGQRPKSCPDCKNRHHVKAVKHAAAARKAKHAPQGGE